MSDAADRIDYDGRCFRSVANTSNGEVSGATTFAYHQRGEIVWATYEGGGIAFGTLVATVEADGGLDMRYSHVNDAGDLRTGVCRTTPEVLADGRLRLHERWRWTGGPDAGSADASGCDESEGTSTLEEIPS